MNRWLVGLSGLLGAVGVTLGAYCAHGLEEHLVQQGLPTDQVVKRLGQCDVAVRYHMLHVLGLLAIGLSTIGNSRMRIAAALFFLLGLSLFCGGLYSMVFLGVMGHWAIVPCGGLCFILGWLAVASLAFEPKPD